MSQTDFQPVQISDFGLGLMTRQEPQKIPLGAASDLKNVVFDSGGAVGPRQGFAIFGNETAGVGEILFGDTYIRRDGFEIPIAGFDDGSTVTLRWYSSVSNTWELLKSGWTTNKRASIYSFNTSSVDAVRISNGTDNVLGWTGAVTNLNGALAGGEATITVDDTTNFPATGTLIIGSTINVTYTGKTATTFTGCSNTPAAADNAGVAILPTEPSLTGTSNPLGRIVVSGQQRAWVAGYDTTGSTLLVSKIVASGGPDNFAFSTTRVPGEGGLHDFVDKYGGPITSLYFKDGTLLVFKRHAIMTYTLQQEDVSTNEFPVEKALIQGLDVGSICHGATTGAYNDVFFVSKKGGIRSLRRTIETGGQQIFDSIDMTKEIKPTIQNYDFSESAGIFFDQKFLLACKNTSAAASNNRVLVYDYVTGGWSIWFMSVNCWFIFDGQLRFGASSGLNCYTMFSGYEDTTGIPIEAFWRSGYLDQHVGKLEESTFMYLEGHISTGTTLNIFINYDDGGRTVQITKTISGSLSNPYILAGSSPTFGSYSIGTNPFGGLFGAEIAAGELNRFRVYLTLNTNVRYHNFDIVIGSSQTGGKWKLVNIGFDSRPVDEIPKSLKV